ncbi:hypothetical protein NKH18_22945 [Streptomyces sp. M10(2022)]
MSSPSWPGPRPRAPPRAARGAGAGRTPRAHPRAVAAVLGLAAVAARELLAAAACEVERTRAALAVVETGNCRTVARLTGGRQVLLSVALRRELVRHVDDCPAAAAPRTGRRHRPVARRHRHTRRRTAGRRGATALGVRSDGPRPPDPVGHPRFDRAGFPLDPKDHAARRDRMRARVVTTTVVATVVAAP